MHIEGSSALVTGGASGLGLATARALAAEGAIVTIVDLPSSRGAEVAAEVGGLFAPADVTSAQEIAAAVAQASNVGPLRVVINCAGVGTASKVLDRDGLPLPLENFERVVRINLIGTYNVLSQASAAMAKTEPDPTSGDRGVIVTTASVAAFDGQIACRIPAGMLRRFAFEKLLPFQVHVWSAIKNEAEGAIQTSAVPIFGSDIAFRMVDFAERNAERAGVAHAVQLRGGDALQRMPPCEQPGVMLLNPPYGERIAAAGAAGRNAGERAADRAQGMAVGREEAHTEDGGEFFAQLAAHWKKNYSGWTAWMLTPDLKLPSKMRLKESRRVPMWNGPIECRMFRFDMIKGAVRDRAAKAHPSQTPDAGPPHAG